MKIKINKKTDSFHNWVNRNSKLNNESKLLWNDSLITWETIFERLDREEAAWVSNLYWVTYIPGSKMNKIDLRVYLIENQLRHWET